MLAPPRFFGMLRIRVNCDPVYRKAPEAKFPEDFAQVIRDTVYTFFDGSSPI